MRKLFSALLLLLLHLASASMCLAFSDLSPDEIIARHLESIAPTGKREALKTLFTVGTSAFESRSPVVAGVGKVVIVSDANDLYFVLSLNSHDYPFEKIGMFGNKVSLPFIAPGHRSFLGGFLADNSIILSENLFSGTLSLRWIDHINDKSRLKMRSAGIKKIDGRQVYALDVDFAKGDPMEFSARLYFDKETFRHVRSEYRHEMQISSPTFGRANQTSGALAEVTEDFTDYRDEAGFMLPHSYKITFSTNSSVQRLRRHGQ